MQPSNGKLFLSFICFSSIFLVLRVTLCGIKDKLHSKETLCHVKKRVTNLRTCYACHLFCFGMRLAVADVPASRTGTNQTNIISPFSDPVPPDGFRVFVAVKRFGVDFSCRKMYRKSWRLTRKRSFSKWPFSGVPAIFSIAEKKTPSRFSPPLLGVEVPALPIKNFRHALKMSRHFLTQATLAAFDHFFKETSFSRNVFGYKIMRCSNQSKI